MNKLKVAVLAACMFAAASASAVLAAGADEKTVKVQALRGPLQLLQGQGGNVVASVGLDGILLIDNDYSEWGPVYEEVIAKFTEGALLPSFVVNTHWHFDHSGNNEYWAGRGAVILAHDNVRVRMAAGQTIEALDREIAPSPPLALPMVTFADSLALHFNGDTLEVQHYPGGHTDGDSVVFYARENVVHMGDLFFKDRFPFIDLSSGGTVAGYIRNVEAVLARVDDDTLIVPGHGSLASRADLERYLGMLKSTTNAVQGALDKGMSIEEITGLTLGAKWAAWGKGFIDEPAWIATIAADHR
ncbi:MAG: MBL fold metallo-hydrolase [Halioglobus sp.]